MRRVPAWVWYAAAFVAASAVAAIIGQWLRPSQLAWPTAFNGLLAAILLRIPTPAGKGKNMSSDTVWLTGTKNGQQVMKEPLINVPAPLDFAVRLVQKLKGADAVVDLKVTGGPFSISGSVEGVELPAIEIPAEDLNWEWSITIGTSPEVTA